MSSAVVRATASDQVAVRYHFTAFSNFAYGYERYRRCYNKALVPNSRYPEKFFLLHQETVGPGIIKAQQLVKRLAIPGDRVIALETQVPDSALHPNDATGVGEFVESSSIHLNAIYEVEDESHLRPLLFEDAYSEAFRLTRPKLPQWSELAPRSVSLLPVARGCQASCPFCFSEASLSREVRGKRLNFEWIEKMLAISRARGAERAVITGGGEPGLLKFSELQRLIEAAASHFPKVVLITNGYFLARLSADARQEALFQLSESGLNVLAISRHHFDSKRNAKLMGLDTLSERVIESWNRIEDRLSDFHIRFICVLQKNGIECSEDVFSYVTNAADGGVRDICFKELYIASHVESFYFNEASNRFSRDHQVPLKIVLDAAAERSWTLAHTLPWGAPVFTTGDEQQRVSIAAYTEPNTTWELSNGICRSWNLMANHTCYASLEDRSSILEIV